MLWTVIDGLWTLILGGGTFWVHRCDVHIDKRLVEAKNLQTEARFYRDEKEAEYNAFKELEFGPIPTIPRIPDGAANNRVLCIEALPRAIQQDIQQWWEDTEWKSNPKRTGPK